MKHHQFPTTYYGITYTEGGSPWQWYEGDVLTEQEHAGDAIHNILDNAYREIEAVRVTVTKDGFTTDVTEAVMADLDEWFFDNRARFECEHAAGEYKFPRLIERRIIDRCMADTLAARQDARVPNPARLGWGNAQ